MSRRVVTVALVVIAVVLSLGRTEAASLKDLLPNLFGANGITLLPTTAHTPHFTVDSKEELTVVNDSLRGQLASVPFPSPASSFTFRFDPALGTFTRSTESFGPIYAQRGETIGRNKIALGFTYSRFTWDSLDGKTLDNGDLAVTFRHEPTAAAVGLPPFAFESDTITARIFADITSDVFVLSATYGLLDNLDLSLAVPIIRNEIRLKGIATINRIGSTPGTHLFANGTESQVVKAHDESTGIGDIVLRAKYNFYRQGPLALATGFDLRLPSGDADELRGIDTVRGSPFFVASATTPFGISPHVNVGVHLGDTSKIENEFFYAAGFDVAVVKPVSLTFDILGRHIIDNKRLRAGQELGGREIAGSDIVDAAFGLKVNPWQNVLLLFNALVPLNSNTGLRDRVTPLVGLEVTF
jgi:hypothetical protein